MSTDRSQRVSDALRPADFSSPSVANEQRKEPRFAAIRTISILPVASTAMEEWKFLPAQLLDCSAHGIGLVSSVPFAVGDQFLVKLKLERMVLVEYTVRHCHRTAMRQYQVGAELTAFAGANDAQVAILATLLSPDSAPQ
jgi:hypothetical protein